jgi:hypothetical protein
MKITPLARAATHAWTVGRWCGPTSMTIVPGPSRRARNKVLRRPAAGADGNDHSNDAVDGKAVHGPQETITE